MRRLSRQDAIFGGTSNAIPNFGGASSVSPHNIKENRGLVYSRPARANLTGYRRHCFPLRRMINQPHKHVDAASLGLPIRDRKEQGLDRLTYAH
jgi:hypothetical protein